MYNINDVIKELKLKEDQLNDKDIKIFIQNVLNRKNSNKWFQYWNGNGYIELNKEDGTLITTVLNDDEEFEAEFPLNIDMNISTVCINNCPFCYEGCSSKGEHSNIRKYLYDKNSFLYSLHKGTELAINGNEPLHPDLIYLLKFCSARGIITNITVNENTLLKHKKELEEWLKLGLIHGVGISPTIYSSEMIEWAINHKTAVIHTITGITTMEQYEKIKNKNLKLLILGYKDFGRGKDYFSKNEERVQFLQHQLMNKLNDFINSFNVVSFDNLAIEQLEIRHFLTQKEWEKFYRGDDGSHTFYIDLVKEKFFKNSIQSDEKGLPLMEDVRLMLNTIKNKG